MPGVRVLGRTGNAGVWNVSRARRSESEWREYDVYDVAAAGSHTWGSALPVTSWWSGCQGNRQVRVAEYSGSRYSRSSSRWSQQRQQRRRRRRDERWKSSRLRGHRADTTLQYIHHLTTQFNSTSTFGYSRSNSTTMWIHFNTTACSQPCRYIAGINLSYWLLESAVSRTSVMGESQSFSQILSKKNIWITRPNLKSRFSSKSKIFSEQSSNQIPNLCWNTDSSLRQNRGDTSWSSLQYYELTRWKIVLKDPDYC